MNAYYGFNFPPAIATKSSSNMVKVASAFPSAFLVNDPI
jgi:hypothetical protein